MNSAVVSEVQRRSRDMRTVSQHSTVEPTARSVRRNDGASERIAQTPLLTTTPRLSREQESDRLHHVLVHMSRGLLQYASQCAPWTPADERDRSEQLSRLAAMQRDSIQRLCDVLVERGKDIDWRVFPVEYTAYNDVSLDFLWPKIADFQRRLVRMLRARRDELQHAPQATTELDNIIQTESRILSELMPTDETNTRSVSIVRGQNGRSVAPLRMSTRGQDAAV